MPAVARFGDVATTGHDCSATATLVGGSSNVFCNTKKVERKGDGLGAHKKGVLVQIPGVGDNPPTQEFKCLAHSAFINAGSTTVFVNGIAIARVGDSADSGAITTGSSNVFAG